MAKESRIAVIDREKCQPKKCAQECIKYCPVNRMNKECVMLAPDRKRAIIDELLCTGCGICVKRCPFKAISIINLPHELEEPLHQFGKNTFRVYRMPIPMKGVVGLVGANGTGKTTLLKILAGELVPNLGDYENKASWDKVLALFKGHEIYNYLEKLKKGRIKLSYKPQEVGRITEVYKSSVRELLSKVDERKVVPNLIEEMEIERCLDKKPSEVSGGELQRIAIIAAMAKKADFYFFDEPSSYLDIRQRLKMAKLIRELGENKNVFVVEHDLAVLDYLTDYIHVLYGKAGVYGVVSTLKNSRSGINEFLEGFLKAENTRIRDHAIRFEVKPPAKKWQSRETYHYPQFTKKYANFELMVEKSDLVKGEVVGIVGPNAIGKSTFMKILAGIEKAEKPISFKAKISYKPQYLNVEEKGSVYEFISKQPIDKELFDSEIKRIVEDLYEKELSKLSGGELQRLAIAVSLAKQCEICLLDEPSAFLDIEQRFHLAEMIKKITEKKEITTLVVDHDIVFQDSVANRILEFSGESAKKGYAQKAVSMHNGMNSFLKGMNITFRRDPDNGRPRMNKPHSQMDEKQRKKQEYYYTLGT